MRNALPMKLTKTQLEEFNAFLGPAPVLTTENERHYNEFWEKLIECFKPQDLMEALLIRQVQNETWKITRYSRHQTVAVDRRFRQSLEFQAQRRKEQLARREALAKEFANKTGRPITDFSTLIHLEDVITSSVSEIDDILQRTPTELDHNRALEQGIVFEEQLDRLINSALLRRNNAIEQLEFYRDGLGRDWRRISDEIIDAEAVPVAGPARELETSTAASDDQGSICSSTESTADGSEETTEVADPLDNTRHWSTRTHVLRAQNQS
jgi:hypothetical protein